MSPKILLTGANGQLGKLLRGKFPNMSYLTHQSCDLANWSKVSKFAWEGTTIIHCANQGQYNPASEPAGSIENNIQMFINLRRRWPNSKLINFGSGAMFDRNNNIVDAEPQNIDQYPYPRDYYSLAKRLTLPLADVTIIVFGIYDESTRFGKAIYDVRTGKTPKLVIKKNNVFSWIEPESLIKKVKSAILTRQNKIFNAIDYNLSLYDLAIKKGISAKNITVLDHKGDSYTGKIT